MVTTILEQVVLEITVLEQAVVEMTVLSFEEMVAAGDLQGAVMPACRG